MIKQILSFQFFKKSSSFKKALYTPYFYATFTAGILLTTLLSLHFFEESPTQFDSLFVFVLGSCLSFFIAFFMGYLKQHLDKNRLNFKKEKLQQEQMIDSIPGAFYRRASDNQHSFSFISPYIQELTGLSPRNFQKRDQEIIHPNDIDYVNVALDSLELNRNYTLKYRMQHSDGSWRWIIDTGALVKSSEEDTLYMLTGALFDITKEHTKNEENLKLSLALKSAMEGIAYISPQGEITSINAAFSNILSEKKDDILHQTMSHFIHPSDKPSLMLLLREARNSGKHSAELCLQHSGKTPQCIRLVVIANYDDTQSLHGFYIFIQDITERKNQENALKEAKKKALEASHTKTEFLSIMGHELRTPLNVILGYASMLQEEALAGSTLKEDLSRIYLSGQHLLELVNDIVDIADIEHGRIELYTEKFSLLQLTSSLQKEMEPLLKRTTNTLHLNIPESMGSMRCDFQRLRHILLNILSNALHATENGVITFSLQEQENSITFTIKDTGPGIAPEKLKRIFYPFASTNIAENRQYDRTGAEIAVIKRVCELLNGNVTIQSTLREGTTFTLTFPRTIVENIPKYIKNGATGEN